MSPVVVANLISAVAAAAVALVALRVRTPLTRAIALGLGAAAWWALAGAGAMTASTPAVAAVLVDLVVLGTVGVVVAAGHYTWALLGRSVSRRARVALRVEPLLVTALTLTDPVHHLVVVEVEVDPLRAQFGPVLWLHAGYGLAVLVVAAAIHLRSAWGALDLSHRRHLVSTGSLLVTAGAVAASLASAGSRLQDYGGASLWLTALAWLWVQHTSTALPGLPITTAQTLQALPDAIVVSDPDGRIVGANDAAARLVAHRLGPGRSLVGAHWTEIADPELLDRVRASGHEVVSAAGMTLDVRLTRLTAPGGTRHGAVTVIRDVSEVERLRAELAEQTVRDGLTGLHNRRYLEQVLPGLAADGRPLAAVMLDLDHFKQINDTHGHAVGDEVLVAVARELAGCLRAGDVLVRFGGEEFLALLPRTTPAVARIRAEECRARVSGLDLRTSGPRLRVTLSAGVAQLHADPDTLLREADDALYAAKAAGRDRVVVAGEPG